MSRTRQEHGERERHREREGEREIKKDRKKTGKIRVGRTDEERK